MKLETSLFVTEVHKLCKRLHQDAKWLGIIDAEQDIEKKLLCVTVEVDKETDDYIGTAEIFWQEFVHDSFPDRTVNLPPVFRTALTIDSHVISFDVPWVSDFREIDGFVLRLTLERPGASQEVDKSLHFFSTKEEAKNFISDAVLPDDIDFAEATLYQNGTPVLFTEYDACIGWEPINLAGLDRFFGSLPHPKKDKIRVFLQDKLCATKEKLVLYAEAIAEDGEPMDVFVLTKTKVKTPICLKKLPKDSIDNITIMSATADDLDDEGGADLLN